MGVMVTVWVAVFGPPQPAALVVIVEVPLHPVEYVTIPVLALMILPAAMLAASRL